VAFPAPSSRPKLIFPPVRIERQGGLLLDQFRRDWVTDTPEEWVRQHLCHWMVNECGIVQGRMQLEYAFDLNGKPMRADVVVFDRQGAPSLLVEVKAPHISITQQVFDQVARYNVVLKAPYVMLTNGIASYIYQITPNGPDFLKSFPQL
jgi:hypothetical protein